MEQINKINFHKLDLGILIANLKEDLINLKYEIETEAEDDEFYNIFRRWQKNQLDEDLNNLMDLHYTKKENLRVLELILNAYNKKEETITFELI